MIIIIMIKYIKQIMILYILDNTLGNKSNVQYSPNFYP